MGFQNFFSGAEVKMLLKYGEKLTSGIILGDFLNPPCTAVSFGDSITSLNCTLITSLAKGGYFILPFIIFKGTMRKSSWKIYSDKYTS